MAQQTQMSRVMPPTIVYRRSSFPTLDAGLPPRARYAV
jgi:hypothetical protein